MHIIPFVKSNSTTADQDKTETTTTSISPSTTNDPDLGIKVAGIYASIVSSTSSAVTTKNHRLPSSLSTLKAKDTATTIPVDTNTETPIYCTSCDLMVRDPAHFHGTAHLVSIQLQPPQQQQQQQPDEDEDEDEDQAVQQQNIPAGTTRLEMIHGKDRAMQLMKKQGWRYGQGLGKTNQGAPYPVTTVWKQDRLGIGHPRTDRRRITHPSISKTKYSTTANNTLKNPRLVNGKQLAANAAAEASLRASMLHYMNH